MRSSPREPPSSDPHSPAGTRTCPTPGSPKLGPYPIHVPFRMKLASGVAIAAVLMVGASLALSARERLPEALTSPSPTPAPTATATVTPETPSPSPSPTLAPTAPPTQAHTPPPYPTPN